MCVFTSCESHRTVENTLMSDMNIVGIGVAVPGACLESDSVLAKLREGIVGSQVRISAGPFANGWRPQWTPAVAPILDPLGVGTLTLPPITPTPFRTMDGFALGELFIVFRSALSPSSEL
jgi:hypothetical protein